MGLPPRATLRPSLPLVTSAALRLMPTDPPAPPRGGASLADIVRRLGEIPFASASDVSVGSEDELQSAVLGDASRVDLPLTIRASSFYENAMRRISSGAASEKIGSGIQHYLSDNVDGVWEHSWVRFSAERLNDAARGEFDSNLLERRADPSRGLRSDLHRFRVPGDDSSAVRLPASAVIRLSLAQAIGELAAMGRPAPANAIGLLQHFGNDNTSPETASCYVAPLRTAGGQCGEPTTRETSLRYLLTAALAGYANDSLGLHASGQDLQVYFSPHPPMRLAELNDCVSDAFYRELFMNPCVAGWEDGQAKHRYMELCHQVLSRSRLSAVAKLREAGIIVNDLVLLPVFSSISLANNGTHVSFGSRSLTHALASGTSEFRAADEKRLGDFVTKVTEHFLPLTTGLYSAAPMRLDFMDFHPERALGFLPHQLDYSNLRQLWQQWKEKARIGIFGRVATPFGPRLVDRFIGRVARLRGDLVVDGRLLDYPVALLSTDRSPALNGEEGNSERLKADLTSLGVFDERMSLYVPIRQRREQTMGFSGFEMRHHSLFESFTGDLTPAVALEALIVALALRYAESGAYDHRDIPDTPLVESERRFPLFASAIGLPCFYVHSRTPNRLIKRILALTDGVTLSRRHRSYLKVPLDGWRLALLAVLRADAPDLVEQYGGEALLKDCERRITAPSEYAAGPRLTKAIVENAGASNAWELDHRDFGEAAEHYYRNTLRARHLKEAFTELARVVGRHDGIAVRPDELRSLERALTQGRAREGEALRTVELALAAIASEAVRVSRA